MDRETVLRMTPNELVKACPSFAPSTGVDEVWPLWERACESMSGLAMRMSKGRCVIFVVEEGVGEWIVVPSGSPAESIRRAYLIACAT